MDQRSFVKDAAGNRGVRSFVKRGRLTPAQKQLKTTTTIWSAHELKVEQGWVECGKVFNREAPVILEIGFGVGQSLLAAAIENPDKNFIGIEAHTPGILRLMTGIAAHHLTNLKFFEADAVIVLTHCIREDSLSGIQLFFPDPWPKRRHVNRRLIQPIFVQQLIAKLQSGGFLHLATDFEDYARQMMRVLSAEPALRNLFGEMRYASRSPYRPIVTKFENRALVAGRTIRELQFVKD